MSVEEEIMANDLPIMMTEVARRFGLSKDRVRQLADAGEIPMTRTASGTRLFNPAEVQHAIEKRAQRQERRGR